MYLAENAQIVPAWVPVDLSTAGATGDWVSMANYNHCTCIYCADVGTAGQDVTLTIEQATTATGTGNKALNHDRTYVKEGATALNAVGVFTVTDVTATNTYQSLTGGENEELVVIEIDASDMDSDGGFDFIQMSASDPGATAGKLAIGLYILTEARHAQEVTVSAIA